jgi:hypothetical protein
MPANRVVTSVSGDSEMPHSPAESTRQSASTPSTPPSDSAPRVSESPLDHALDLPNTIWILEGLGELGDDPLDSP